MFRRIFLGLSVFAAMAFSSYGQLGKGHEILLQRGLQLQGMVSHLDPFNLNTYSNANYSTISLFWDPEPSYLGAAPSFPWARWARSEAEMPPLAGEAPYMSQLVTLQLGDEWNLNDDATRTTLVNWFNAVRTNYPNTILFHNNYGGQVGDAQLGDFVSRARPDMLAFDTYPWIVTGDGTPRPEYEHYWYSDMRRYREHARGANIPLASYLQTFNSTSDNARKPSLSELRLQVFASLAFNCKTLIDFTYNTSAGSMFTNSFGGDNAPNELYYEKMECNRQARIFGKALVRLKPIPDEYFPDLRTTSMMFIRGRDSAGTPNPFPIGFQPDFEDGLNSTEWAQGRNDPYLLSWAVTNKGTRNNGQRGNVIVSWFNLLDESFDGPNYTNEIYMMVVNGLHDITGTGPDCLQEVRLNFASELTAIEILNPQTGVAELQALPLTNGVRQLVLNLNGGDGVLFKFSTGAPFVGAQSFGPPVFTTQPRGQAVVPGANASFTAGAFGDQPLTYQWRFNGENIPGATFNTLTLTNVQPMAVGTYTVVASNALGTVTSSAASLTLRSPTLLLYEPFDYANVGSAVNSNVPANWVPGGTGTNDFNVANGNLSYPGLAASLGNSATNGGVGLGMRRLLGTNVNSGKVYFSALLRINHLGFGSWNGAGTQVGAFTAPDNTTFRLQVMVKSNSPNGYVIGVQKGGAGTSIVYDTVERRANEVILLVGRYDFETTPNTVSLWINPGSSTIGNEVAPTSGVLSSTAGADGSIDRFNFRQNTAASIPAAIQWDELRVGSSWGDVTPLGAPLRLSFLTSLDADQLRIRGIGDPGSVVLQTSTNLMNWTDVTTLVSENGQYEHSEALGVDQAQRFYRLKDAP